MILTLWTSPPLPRTHSLLLSPWQPNSWFIIPTLNKLTPQSLTILSHLAAQLLHHFNPLNILPPLFHHFTHLADQLLPHLNPSEKIPPHFHAILPPWQLNFLFILATQLSWQPDNYFILHSLNKLCSHSYTILFPLAAQPYFNPPNRLPPHSCTNLPPFGSPALTSFNPSEKYLLTLTPF